METKWGTVAVEVTVEVVAQETGELLAGLDVGARVHHVATRKGFIEGWVITSVQLVHDHLPNWVASARAVMRVTVALMRHSEVEGVRPDGHPTKGGSDRSVVDEELIGHHFELFVTADSQVRGTDANDGTIGDVGETFNNQTSASHFRQPIIVSALRPVLWVVFVCQRKHGNFVSLPV